MSILGSRHFYKIRCKFYSISCKGSDSRRLCSLGDFNKSKDSISCRKDNVVSTFPTISKDRNYEARDALYVDTVTEFSLMQNT